MMNRLDLTPGDIIRVRDRDPRDAMAYYVFRSWSDVRPSPKVGRIANLTWCYNGTPRAMWEADMAPDPDVHRDLLRTRIEDAHAANPCNTATPVVA